MSRTKSFFSFILLLLVSLPALAAPGGKGNSGGTAEVAAAFELHAVKIDYANNFIVIEGVGLDPATAGGSIGGASLPAPDPSSTDTTLLFPFSPAISAAVDELGNYTITFSNASGSITLSVFIPFALAESPTPPPPGMDCPCSNEWDLVSTTPSPDGFAGQDPYCSEDHGNFVTVQFYDVPQNLYWVLWTGWDGSSGYCELYIDGTNYTLTTQDEFDACANYLRGMVTVWGGTCLL